MCTHYRMEIHHSPYPHCTSIPPHHLHIKTNIDKNAELTQLDYNIPELSEDNNKLVFTGGEPLFTHWVHGEYMVGSETKYPAWTHRAHFDYFYNLPPIHPPKYPPGTC